MELLILSIVFLAYLGYREFEHSRHIKDLETKLVSRDAVEYAQYKSAEKPTPNEIVKDDAEDFIDPFDADPNAFLKGRHGGN